ncbi:BCCT family transporter [Chitinibacteraceae bacterium HSL-7]
MNQRHNLQLPVFIPSIGVIAAVVAYCATSPRAAEAALNSAQAWISGHFSWFYILAVSGFLLMLVGLAVSKYGSIRLGPDESEPEFSLGSWLAMLFAAGMGIGLMYYGVGEPLQHYMNPPVGDGQTMVAAKDAMQNTFLHWGFHPWAIYGVVGLVLAYFGFRYNLPLALSSGLYPLLRERVNGPIGHAVNVFALSCTLFGIAPSLGLGVAQLAAGIHTLTGWDTSSVAVQVGLIAAVISLACLSAATGIGRGVRRLSELNLMLALLLMLFVLFTGPTLYLLGAFGENVGNYLGSVVSLTFRSFAYEPGAQGWLNGWTILYWAWWISWSPFVGLFIARISRGRTIRQFIVGVILIPSVFTFLWMTVFGNSVIWLDMNAAGGELGALASNVDALLFRFFDYLPLPTLTSALSLVLITVFFVTSADSGALMLDTLASKPEQASPLWQRVFWCVVLGASAATLFVAGGHKALLTMALITALPFTVVMVLLCYSLLCGLAADARHSERRFTPASSFWSGEHWKARLDQILHQPTKADVTRFIDALAVPAFAKLQDEFKSRGIAAHVDRDADDAIALVVPQPNLRDFVYGIRAQSRELPAFALRDVSLPASERAKTWEPVTYFADGRRGYDVEYLREPELIADVLKQYERYLTLSHGRKTHILNTAPEHGPEDA